MNYMLNRLYAFFVEDTNISYELIPEKLKHVQELAAKCQQAAIALIETRNSWIGKDLFSLFRLTDYERARDEVLNNLCQAARGVAKARRESINPAAIRTAAYLKRLKKCCRHCHEENEKAAMPGNNFYCRLQEILRENEEQTI